MLYNELLRLNLHMQRCRLQASNHPGSRRPVRCRRRGYALLMCLLAIAICSSIVVGIFQAQRVHVAEAAARRQIIVLQGLQQAAREHAIATLVERPTFRGTVGPISVVDYSNRRYEIQISDGGAGIVISTTAQADGNRISSATLISQSALTTRRTALGL